MDDIADWRSCIDDIDLQLLKLLNERARCAYEIGMIKASRAMKIHNPVREREILSKLSIRRKTSIVLKRNPSFRLNTSKRN